VPGAVKAKVNDCRSLRPPVGRIVYVDTEDPEL